MSPSSRLSLKVFKKDLKLLNFKNEQVAHETIIASVPNWFGSHSLEDETTKRKKACEDTPSRCQWFVNPRRLFSEQKCLVMHRKKDYFGFGDCYSARICFISRHKIFKISKKWRSKLKEPHQAPIDKKNYAEILKLFKLENSSDKWSLIEEKGYTLGKVIWMDITILVERWKYKTTTKIKNIAYVYWCIYEISVKKLFKYKINLIYSADKLQL